MHGHLDDVADLLEGRGPGLRSEALGEVPAPGVESQGERTHDLVIREPQQGAAGRGLRQRQAGLQHSLRPRESLWPSQVDHLHHGDRLEDLPLGARRLRARSQHEVDERPGPERGLTPEDAPEFRALLKARLKEFPPAGALLPRIEQVDLSNG
jgi:hypothetical protein